MKIYTKTGDDGTTALLGNIRVPKFDPRIEAYGTIDELNAIIGWTASSSDTLRTILKPVQDELFVIGSILACPDASKSTNLPTLSDSSITRLEQEIDAADAVLPPLKNFILPGGSEPASRLHIARTVCRRAERLAVEVASTHFVPPAIVIYLNRLSDWLFVQARLANHLLQFPDIPWQSR
jgi:cob(I)alamin adenosyltransferase